MKIILLLEMHF